MVKWNADHEGEVMNEREREDFEKWAERLEGESAGTKWGVTLYALWDVHKTLFGLIDALAQDRAQGAGKLNELIGKGGGLKTK